MLKLKRFMYSGGWQLNVWKLQLNWTPKCKEHPNLPWGLVAWFNGHSFFNAMTKYKER